MWADLKLALRSLRRNPGFSIAAILTLSIGLGASTAIFTVLNSVMMRSLPYAEAERIVTIESTWKNRPGGRGTVSAPDFHDWRNQSTSFESMAYWFGGELGIKTGEQGEFAGVFVVSSEFTKVMKAIPVQGRLFSTEEMTPNGPLAALVSADFARSHYGDEQSAIHRSIMIAAVPYSIVGVLGNGFHYPVRGTVRADVWLPSSAFPEFQSRTAQNYRVLGRLKPGVSVEQAQAEMNTIASGLQAAYPKENKDKDALVSSLQNNLTKDAGATLWLLMGAVGLLLLLACANVANMLLAKSVSRTKEIALRIAVGASRWSIIRQLLAESLILSLCASAAGFGIAAFLVDALIILAPKNLPRLDEIHLDLVVAGFTFIAALMTTLVFGLIPALQTSNIDLNEAIKQSGQRSSHSGKSSRTRNALVVVEIALSLVLMIGAGLLFRSFVSLMDVEMGFRPEKLLVMSTSVPSKDLDSVKKATLYFENLNRQLQSIPGVQSAAGVMGLPTGNRNSNGAYQIEGRKQYEALSEMPFAGFRVTTPNYFKTMGTPLLMGRDFEERDRYESPLVVIVNKRLVEAQFPDGNVLGKRIECGLDRPGEWMTIIGVVGDVRHENAGVDPKPEIYMPHYQHPWMADELHVVVRVNEESEQVVQEMRKLAVSLNPDVSTSITTMETMLSDSLSASRFRLILLGVFSGIAMLLAMMGVYSVMAYVMSQRTVELGLRMALGATPGDLLQLVMRQALLLTLTGIIAGLILSVLMSRSLSVVLYGTSGTDLFTYAVSVGFIAIVAILAALIPAIRSARVDPVDSLRAT